MDIRVLEGEFSVVKLADFSQLDLTQAYTFASRTDRECSLVCLTANVPAKTKAREDGWAAFRIEGQLDFSLVGILARISGLLADHGISIFAISTFDTDYLLVKKEQLDRTLTLLEEADYRILRQEEDK